MGGKQRCECCSREEYAVKLCYSCCLERLEEECALLDESEDVLYKNTRTNNKHEYARYKKCVKDIRLQRNIIKMQLPQSKSAFPRAFRAIGKAFTVIKRNVRPEEVWYFHGEGLINDE